MKTRFLPFEHRNRFIVIRVFPTFRFNGVRNGGVAHLLHRVKVVVKNKTEKRNSITNTPDEHRRKSRSAPIFSSLRARIFLQYTVAAVAKVFIVKSKNNIFTHPNRLIGRGRPVGF